MADWRHTTPMQLLDSHLNRLPGTTRAYAADLRAFAAFLKADSPQTAVEIIVGAERGAARRMLEDFKNASRAKGLSLATTRRRVSSLLGLLALAHEFDIIPWAIRMKLPAADPIRDTAGPGRPVVERMIELCQQRDDAKGRRDYAILCLLFYNALRAGEVLSLDLRHVDLSAGDVLIAAKARWDRVRMPIPLVTRRAIEQWLQHRGDAPGPLWLSMQRGEGERRRLTYRGLYEMVRTLGRQTGAKCWPHALRHAAATSMLNLSNGNIGWGLALTRHRDPKTFLAYADRRGMAMRSAVELLAGGRQFRSEPPTVEN
ncbi:MAG: Tyrosine recombinase XerC [Phycisphaerae bacterium]|nr:Tyrosine recombinase XerC [Phycisphaerae bacterium]